MSTGALVDRSSGQVILENFWNDIHAILEGDFVGRDVSGSPVSGNSLGTLAFPWGTAYLTNLVLNGSAISSSQLESPPYKIVSGRKRTTSNQPLFLVPAGSSANFSVKGAITPFVFQVSGAVGTIATDITVAVTTAAGSNNTATVNDATATGQVATRTWGEYGSGPGVSPYYPITMSGVGSNIQSKVGTYQAFKIGTEYFIAHVESLTTLSRAIRGYFFNSSDAPVKRVAFSNGATITLLNLGFVFADVNGSTVDVIFTAANSAPTYSYVAPGTPASGDYWYDLGNSVWKRYNGSSFIAVSRTLIGVVCADSTNCIGARSFDFFGQCRSDNTMEVGWISNTVVQATGPQKRLNVNGQRIDFLTSMPKWDMAANNAAAADRYNSSITLSTIEYLYVSDIGETIISDMDPYWRADLLGYYHPFNPWRAVGQVPVDASVHFTAAGLRGFSSIIFPIQSIPRSSLIVPRTAISPNNSGAFTDTGSVGTWTDVTFMTVTIETTGRPVLMWLEPDNATADTYIEARATANAAEPHAQWRFLKDGSSYNTASNFGTLGLTGVQNYIRLPPGSIWFRDDNCAAGIHTFKFQVNNINANVTIKVNGCYMKVMELA